MSLALAVDFDVVFNPSLEITGNCILAHNRLGVHVSLLPQVLQLLDDFGLSGPVHCQPMSFPVNVPGYTQTSHPSPVRSLRDRAFAVSTFPCHRHHSSVSEPHGRQAGNGNEDASLSARAITPSLSRRSQYAINEEMTQPASILTSPQFSCCFHQRSASYGERKQTGRLNSPASKCQKPADCRRLNRCTCR